jgi:hypothetical protein
VPYLEHGGILIVVVIGLVILAYDCMELHKKSNLKEVKIEYVRGCRFWDATQIWSFENIGIQ